MKKKYLSLVFLLMFCVSMVLPVCAAGSSRLDDNADYLTDSEETALLSKLNEISTRQGMDVVVVTIPALYGNDITAFADDYYDENGYLPDGILLLVSDYDREWAISTTGYCITAFTDAGLDYMANQFADLLSAGEYSAAFDTYAELCDEFISQAKTGRPYDVGSLPRGTFNVGKTLLISLGIGLFAALIVTGVMRSKLKTVRAQTAASEYVKSGSMKVTERRDMFLYRQVRRQKRESSSSGGSSTHRSSSGRSHGGSRGSF
ncbi:MAG: TPM domain-containing protein [Ruminococcaceae bacterium]|nr:TPM domain-containing protein [Oscillospiraceae bacterium]